ncbi:glycosyltransferase family 2 protein [Paraburkholderia sp. LEh10]|jgi:glycosyltransferase involved in cell wall biosynthesis|uniref:glycosyltransferase family 2 protein n=1 Tax=Paraburkholderia sp. LEh10 TaxID=2821353 RepID=UPI001AE3D051|nr:glycosyltransferase family A protein [Paraburkholderia sp. LEh10]MBP0589685.1 glycosyltransferase family 2 protein [Paraburkholderia sp. LEh10]
MKEIAIVICNYNYERFLAEAIDSALAQDYEGTRVIVIDDGSTDGSRAMIEQYGSRVAAIFKENGGQVSAYNVAVEMLDTEFVIFLDSDDVLYPGVVSEVMREFENSDVAKVQFRLDVIDVEGNQTGAYVPHSAPPSDCRRLLMKGWLYPSPPASGNAYRLSALKQVFPVPETGINRYGADFYAIYGVALVGPVATISRSLGSYRVHHTIEPSVSFANSEQIKKAPRAFKERWVTLREVARARLNLDLPPSFYDFAHEKSYFGSSLYRAPLSKRWRWMAHESHDYLHTIIANPFWSLKKKLGTLFLSSLCLLPFSPLSDFVIRYITNPLARRGAVAEQERGRHAT